MKTIDRPLSIGGNVNLFPNRELLLASFPAMQPTLGAWQLVTNSGRSLCESMPCQRYWKQIRNIQNGISNWGSYQYSEREFAELHAKDLAMGRVHSGSFSRHMGTQRNS